MKRKVGILIAGILLSAVLGNAEETCPWINTATVIDAPDSSVNEVQSTVANGGDSCLFHYRKADRLYSMQVKIRTAAGNDHGIAADEAQCRSGKTALAGIGNEAVLCSTGAHGERVVGRVRDKIFIIDVDVRVEHGSTEMTKSLGDIATLMAEQVAGSLF
jgi:hypothetical protein